MSRRRRKNERGVALIMVLLIVTLLTILVVEFTYSVQVETHISRNSVNALQATYLARSGINILAGALRQDEDRQVDPGLEDGWRYFALGPCQNILENETWMPPTWSLCGRIVDESGKINVNFTKPPPPNPNQTQAPDRECKPTTPAAVGYCWRDAIARLAAPAGVDVESLKQEIDDYWVTGIQPTKLGAPTQLLAAEFGSLEDVAASFPLLQDRTIFDAMRRHVTALPASNRVQARRLNINTVPAPVLRALLAVTNNDEALADEIVARRQETPFKSPGEAFESVENKAGLLNMFQTQSNLFRIEASAVVNGVGKSVRALVLREQVPPPAGAPPDSVGWRLTYLDWQKESGIGVAKDAQADNPDEGLEGDDNSAKDES